MAGALALIFTAAAAAAEDSNSAQASTPGASGAATISSAVEERDGALVAFDARVRRYFGAEGADTFIAPDTSFGFQEGRRAWMPLLSLNSGAGLSVGLGAGRFNTPLGSGDPARNQYAVGLGARYQGEALSWYLAGLKSVSGLDSSTGSYGDSTRYRISAGGAMNGIPVGVGLDVSYLDRGDQTRGGETGFGPGVAGNPKLSVEELLFSGFLDGESSLYRRPGGSAKADVANFAPSSQGKGPVGIRAIGGHLQFRPSMDTAFQLGGAYLQFVEDAASSPSSARDETLGTAMYLRLSHGITDSLQLKAAFDYLFPSDATRQARGEEDAYKVAAGLFWSW